MNPVFSTLKPHTPDTLDRPDRWRDHAVCRDEDPELFFPAGETGPSAVQVEEAKAVCRRCPVMDACLQWATQSGQEGVWGGTSEKDRKNLRRRQIKAAAKQSEPTEQAAPECGTTKAYYQHLFAGEPVDAKCQAASDAYEEKSAAQKTRQPAQCGTRGGYQKHIREHTKICAPCRQANTDADRRLRNTGTTKAVAA